MDANIGMRDMYRVRLISASQPESEAVIRLGKNFAIILNYGGGCVEKSDRDYFESFCRIREHLETQGLRPHCHGASLNVFPSGMTRQMGGGQLAYRLAMGRSPGKEDLVDIFESTEDVVPVSVQEQAEFFKLWLKSLAAR